MCCRQDLAEGLADGVPGPLSSPFPHRALRHADAVGHYIASVAYTLDGTDDSWTAVSTPSIEPVRHPAYGNRAPSSDTMQQCRLLQAGRRPAILCRRTTSPCPAGSRRRPWRSAFQIPKDRTRRPSTRPPLARWAAGTQTLITAIPSTLTTMSGLRPGWPRTSRARSGMAVRPILRPRMAPSRCRLILPCFGLAVCHARPCWPRPGHPLGISAPTRPSRDVTFGPHSTAPAAHRGQRRLVRGGHARAGQGRRRVGAVRTAAGWEAGRGAALRPTPEQAAPL